jgi:hypothetical protein
LHRQGVKYVNPIKKLSDLKPDTRNANKGTARGSACEKTRRKCFMMELSPAYCDVIVTRWQNATGGKAVLHGSAS